MALMTYLSPIKIDGTAAKTAHRAEVIAATAYQEARVASPSHPVLATHKLTFDERMAAEDARSVKANKVVTDEIK